MHRVMRNHLERKDIGALDDASTEPAEARRRARAEVLPSSPIRLLTVQALAGNRAVVRAMSMRAEDVADRTPTGVADGNESPAPSLQRVVRVTAPRRGATAVGRIPAFMDRLNAVSRGLAWTRNGEDLAYLPKPGIPMNDFDRRMQAFVDRNQVVPLRMITRAGLSKDVGMANLAPVFIDQLQEGYVDLDDLLACDDDSFRLNMIHFVVERFAVPNYARRIGGNLNAAFPGAHAAGLRAERDHLRERLSDPTIRMPTTSALPGGGTRFSFRGEGYRVRHDFRPRPGNLEPGVVTVRQGTDTLGIDEFILRREAKVRARELEQSMGGNSRGQIGP